MVKRAEERYHCFRCGASSDLGLDYEISVCSSCGEVGLLSITTALDMLNDLHLQGLLIKQIDEDEYEQEISNHTGDW